MFVCAFICVLCVHVFACIVCISWQCTHLYWGSCVCMLGVLIKVFLGCTSSEQEILGSEVNRISDNMNRKSSRDDCSHALHDCILNKSDILYDPHHEKKKY